MSWDIRTKKARNFSVYSCSEVFGVTRQKNITKSPRLQSASISTIILFRLLVAKLSEQKNKAKTLFQYVCKLNVRKLTIRYVSSAIYVI